MRINEDVSFESLSHVNYINGMIQNLDDVNAVSDGYHTFGELYDHRCVLYIALCAVINKTNYEVWRSVKHSDGSQWDGWFVLGINSAPGEQVTYHLPESLWDKCDFAETLKCAPEFDGHTSSDVLQRLNELIDYELS